MSFVKITDPKTGARRWVTPALVPAADLVAKIDQVLAEAEFVTWDGRSDDAADSTRHDLDRPRRPLARKQAAMLRFVYQHAGCSQHAAGHGAGYCGDLGAARAAYGLWRLGLLEIDATRRNRYALTITREGIAALTANAARVGWVTGDPAPWERRAS